MRTTGRCGLAAGIALAILLATLAAVALPGWGRARAPRRAHSTGAGASRDRPARRGAAGAPVKLARAPDRPLAALPRIRVDEDDGEEAFSLDIDDLWKLSDDELAAACRGYGRYRYRGPEFRAVDPAVVDELSERLRKAAPGGTSGRSPIRAALSNCRNRAAILRDVCLEGTFMLACFGTGACDTSLDDALPRWRRDLEALGLRLDGVESHRVGEVLLRAHRGVQELEGHYRARAGASDAWGITRSFDLSVLARQLLERDLVEYYYDWERALREALTAESFAVLEKLLRGLGLESGKPAEPRPTSRRTMRSPGLRW